MTGFSGLVDMVSLHLPSCLQAHPREARLIGDLLTQYGELEWMLCRVVGELNRDLDGTIKAMFRVRGELSRLQIADALSSSHLNGLAIRPIFIETLAAVDVCRNIRNSYAHAHWLSHESGEVGYYDLEALARGKGLLDLRTMNQSLIDHSILADQSRFFAEVLHNLIHMFYELDARSMGGTFDTSYIAPLRVPKRAMRVDGKLRSGEVK